MTDPFQVVETPDRLDRGRSKDGDEYSGRRLLNEGCLEVEESRHLSVDCVRPLDRVTGVCSLHRLSRPTVNGRNKDLNTGRGRRR